MAYEGKNVKLSYENSSLLPEKDSTRIEYLKFKNLFGEDGNVIVIGTINPELFKLDQFNAWTELGDNIRKVDGVLEVLNISRAINLVKNEETHQFSIVPVVNQKPTTQAEVDSLKNTIHKLKFYEGLLYNSKTNATLMTVTLDKKKINDISRIAIIKSISEAVNAYKTKNNVEIHCSGMPYIRTVTMQKVKHELFLFVIISIFVATFIMFLFFKSIRVILSSLLIVGVSIVWVMGTLVLFGYKITILTGVIPSLIVIIVIENCIYILNKYHWEYRSHGNKMRALSQVIHRIGFASLMTNAATALGFAAFILVPNQMLREFGIITSINIMVLYVLTITLLPIIFSLVDPPTPKHLKHLDNNFFGAVLDKIIYLISHRRNLIYSIAGGLIVVGFIGLSMMKTSGKIVDDFRSDDPTLLDLKFFESNFGGVMPFEISVDTKKRNGILVYSTIQKIDKLQNAINEHPEFSKPLSLIEVFKFARQAYYNGDSSKYTLPSSMEKNFIFGYIPQNVSGNGNNLLKSFIDSTKQITRISYQMADVGTNHMDSLMANILPQVDSIFDRSKFDVTVTGNSVVYAKGTNFLIRNLFESVIIAIILISILMAFLFVSFRMILVSMVPNIIPLVITAAIMGFAGIPIKPSTIIVFSIALGISVDNAIQYLSRYRHELKANNGAIKLSALNALREAGFSMIYTSIVLVLGFSVFMVSEFGGTQALGVLISTTLLIAMFFNIMVLPSLLLTLDKRLVSKAFTEPIIEIYEENEAEDNELAAEFTQDDETK
ncbi:integral membrane protein [Aquipluma nitroreducens]|uniref:Integral membrane protein n=2 Tax=Aquipluma nitroreducens TaxID=2010828 RepID=A0A5K7S790_9BACT|nr:integral membrane protein [Aquipluma nitroreducens]